MKKKTIWTKSSHYINARNILCVFSRHSLHHWTVVHWASVFVYAWICVYLYAVCTVCSNGRICFMLTSVDVWMYAQCSERFLHFHCTDRHAAPEHRPKQQHYIETTIDHSFFRFNTFFFVRLVFFFALFFPFFTSLIFLIYFDLSDERFDLIILQKTLYFYSSRNKLITLFPINLASNREFMNQLQQY